MEIIGAIIAGWIAYLAITNYLVGEKKRKLKFEQDKKDKELKLLRDKAAHDVMGNWSFEEERNSILSLSRSIVIDAKILCEASCGGFFKKRFGIFGKFYGCSNYPTCKNTRNEL